MSESYSEETTSGAGAPRALQIYCAIERPELLAVVRESLHSFLPGSVIATGHTALPGDRIPRADCVVLDTHVGGATGVEAARALRIAGFDGGIILLVPELSATGFTELPTAPEERLEERAATRTSGPTAVRLAAMGVSRTVPYAAIAGELPFAVVTASLGTESAPLEEARRELRAAQRLNAMGDLAASVQHAANNPLTALLAEAQLLEMEPLAPEHREAVQRIIDLSRRLALIIRKLDLPRAR